MIFFSWILPTFAEFYELNTVYEFYFDFNGQELCRNHDSVHKSEVDLFPFCFGLFDIPSLIEKHLQYAKSLSICSQKVPLYPLVTQHLFVLLVIVSFLTQCQTRIVPKWSSLL